MIITLFDLDNTLLSGDSDHAWMDFLITSNVVESKNFSQTNKCFYDDYVNGRLDINAYINFQLSTLSKFPRAKLDNLYREFFHEKILSMISNRARKLVHNHRQRGDLLVIITATNRFIAAPIATELGVNNLLATEPEVNELGNFTGKIVGTPCFQAGKIEHLRDWLKFQDMDLYTSLRGSRFYSDSYNDLPLLEAVDFPVAVDPDLRLRATAQNRGWPILSLHDHEIP